MTPGCLWRIVAPHFVADLVVTLRERYEEGGDKSYRQGFEDGVGVAADLVERGGV